MERSPVMREYRAGGHKFKIVTPVAVENQITENKNCQARPWTNHKYEKRSQQCAPAMYDSRKYKS